MSDAPLRGRGASNPIRRPARGGRSLFSSALVLVAGVLVASGCATKGDLRDLRSEVRRLSERQDSLQRTMIELQRAALDSLGAQSDVLFNIRGELGRQLLDVQEQLVAVQELTGQSQRSLAGLRDQIEARRTAIVRGEAQGDAAAEGADTAAAPPSGVEAGGGPQELFNVAVRQFNRGSVTTAGRAFERFLQQYPNHRLAPDAHFYLADVLVQENRLEEAVDAFLEIPELFPTAERVPQALYRAGLLRAELGDTEEARELLERVVDSYPDSGAAILAEERLNELPEP